MLVKRDSSDDSPPLDFSPSASGSRSGSSRGGGLMGGSMAGGGTYVFQSLP
jgi:hypothetical protein